MTTNIRPRAVLLGLALGLVLSVLPPFTDAYLRAAPLAVGHFPLAPAFLTIWLALFCAGWARLGSGKSPLSGMELLFVWLLMTICAGIAGTGLAETFFVNVTTPERLAESGYAWTDTLAPLLPKSWFLDQKTAVEAFYNGIENGREMGLAELIGAIPWGVWLGPTLSWAGFIGLCYLLMICLSNLLGRQWVVNERAHFPLLRPLTVLGQHLDAGGTTTYFLNRFLLTGLAISLFIHLFGGLHHYFPSVPEMPTLILAGRYFPKFGLWQGYHKLTLYLIPSAIGFAFLTTRQISFSLWFFYLAGAFLYGLLFVVGLQAPEAAMGSTFGVNLSRPAEAQTIGSFLVYFLFILWLARRTLADGARCALGPLLPRKGRGETCDPSVPGEDPPPAWAVWGFVLSLGGVMLWSASFGLPLLAALLLPVLFVLVVLVTARLVCQGGLPFLTMTAAPVDGLIGLFGTGMLGKMGIVAVAVMEKVLFVNVRDSLLPTLFHGQKVTEEANNRNFAMLGMGAAMVLGAIVSLCAWLVAAYRYGLRDMDMDWAVRTTQAVFENAGRLVEQPVGPNPWLIWFAVAGAVVMVLLVIAYARLPWWPLHPLGYLAAYSASMRILWFCFFIGWLANHLVLHYGGSALYNKVRYLFFGLIAGDLLAGGVWWLVGLFHAPGYNVFPF